MKYDETDLAFFAKHQGGSGAVWLVELTRGGHSVRSAVFSSKELADHWLETVDVDFTASFSLPLVVDVPEYGNEETN